VAEQQTAELQHRLAGKMVTSPDTMVKGAG